LIGYQANTYADDTQMGMVERCRFPMAKELEYMILQLIRSADEGDLVDLVNGKKGNTPLYHRPIFIALGEFV
jgi:hypothetical protein